MKNPALPKIIIKNKFTVLLVLVLLLSVFTAVSLVNKPKDIKLGEAVLQGDCNQDGTVNILDFQLLSNTFGKSSGQTGYDGRCDFDGSNSINILDFQILSNNFGKTGPTNTPTVSIQKGFVGISEGQTVSGNIFVAYEANPDSTASVQFFIDGNSQRTERVLPYALAGDTNGTLLPYDTTKLSNGSHALSVKVTNNDNSTYNDQLSFKVQNTTLPTSTPTPTNTATTSTPIPTGTKTPTPTNKLTSTPYPTPKPGNFTCFGAPADSPTVNYPEPRVFLESQSWWSDEQNPFPGQHIHMGTCFPLLQEISGVLHFDVKGILHEDPGEVTFLRVQIWPDIDPAYRQNMSWRCPKGQNCVRWFSINVDTKNVSGRKEFRFTLAIPNTPIGNKQFETTRWHAILKNGGSGSDYENADRTGSAGWYTVSDYSNIRIRGNDALKASYGTVSGIWSPEVRGDKDRFVASVDPCCHGANPGLIQFDGAGNSTWRKLSIDTTKLTNGVHKLMLRTDDENVTIGNAHGISSGVFVLPFKVQN